MRREFLQLAHKYEPEKHNIAGWYVSEKLDGQRCFWDGGVTRGKPTETVPWASILDPKTGERKAKIKPVSTGLWSRYGNPIMAPDWWLDELPRVPLDGELWCGRGKFQLCRSIVGGDTPDARFNQVVFVVYSAPTLTGVLTPGEIKNTNMWCQISSFNQTWAKRFRGLLSTASPQTFQDEMSFLRGALFRTPETICRLHRQTKLIDVPNAARDQVDAYLSQVLDLGGEGVVLRDPDSVWTPKRHRGILKYKPFFDAEARIIGFTSGRETNKGSRLLGKIGALIVNYDNQRLDLAGLTDDEREFADSKARDWAVNNPGVDAPYWVEGKHFKVGQTITFKYRELSDAGIPKEARLWRRRDSE